jgi:class 3 adenylate cyclase/tetratricopeptide (TPR) repeat protein
MKCPRCQHDNREGRRFCSKCGGALALRCASCGFLNEPGDEFCGGCGASLVPAGSSVAPKFTSPETYTPKHLAEKILTSKAALEGERKQVTVLFADLKGSMELLADRDPEEARRLLDPVLHHMMEAVHHYEGTVNQVMGDGIMALFGAPLAHEDHAVRACYAALRMQQAVRRQAQEARRVRGIEPQIRVGLHSGEVVVRSIGSDLHMDYTAVGQTTHLAARMEQLAPPSSIRITSETARLVEGYVELSELGPVPVKGLPDPVDVYELTGAAAVRSRLRAGATRGFTRFIGRDAELEQLRAALEQARSGHGQLVAVVGEPGVGKSRLNWEFTHSHRLQGWLILQSGSVSYGKATAYLPVTDLLKGYFRIEARDETQTVREKVTGKVLALDRGLEPCLSALLSLLEVPVEDEAWERLDPPQRRQRTLDAVKRLLLRESQVQPLILLFEDLHWIDAETQALLDSLVESLPTAHLLLLANYRPEYQHLWGSKTYYRQLRVDPLPPPNADDLLTNLLGADSSLEPLKRTLIERTDGNPLFLEESARTLAETKALVGERGAYRLARDVTALQVPATVQAILAARIDRLSPEDKRLLQAASVIGSDVPFALLLAIAELTEEDLRRGLVHLQGAEFLYETSLFPDLAYTFKHALTHEVAYGSLLQERRRALHGAVLAAIERLHAGRLDEHLEELTRHAVRSESWDKAVAYGAEAAARAKRRWALRGALANLEQALAALGQLPRTSDNLRRTVDLHLEARGCLVQLGEAPSMLGHVDRADAAAEALRDDALRAIVTGHRAHTYWSMGQYRRALEVAEDELILARRASDRSLEASANFHMGQTRCLLGEFEVAAELEGRVLDLLVEHPERERGPARRPRATQIAPLEVVARVWRVHALGELGRFAEAARVAREAIEIARAANNPYALGSGISVWGRLCARQGNFDGAIPLLEEGLQFSRTLGFQTYLSSLGNLLAEARARVGRRAEAQALLDEVPAVSAARHVHGGNYTSRPLALLLVGRLGDARGLAAETLPGVRERGERGAQAWLLWLLSEISAREAPGDTGTAAQFRQARALAEELRMRPLVAHCHLGLGKLYRRTGQREQAQEHLTTATTMYREMDMRFWLEQAEAETRGWA